MNKNINNGLRSGYHLLASLKGICTIRNCVCYHIPDFELCKARCGNKARPFRSVPVNVQ